jgi:hypothetical protein
MPVIRISDTLYKRLEDLAKGFDTPTGVIERLLDQSEGHHSTKSNSAMMPTTRKPELVFIPGDEEEFKALLIKKQMAHVLLSKSDGSAQSLVWKAGRFGKTANLRGNIFSGYLRNWKEKGIVKAEFAIDKTDIKST